MSDQLKDLADIPKDFIKDGTQFLNRCTKPDKREFLKISQAVGVGFIVMGVIGYIVKLTDGRARDAVPDAILFDTKSMRRNISQTIARVKGGFMHGELRITNGL
ncbi:hypothetical protein M8818_005498 [Zalaria obscura]|uniref:Uncharacterized protein n=1 Tax=Zalaria obscura TaxID=2024903 RepID=A0ACC3S929_9PEZI